MQKPAEPPKVVKEIPFVKLPVYNTNRYNPQSPVYHPGDLHLAWGEYGDVLDYWECCNRPPADPGCVKKNK
jgi:hypothetical protein